MADTVQYLLEDQIPELEEFERKGFFTRAELKQIIAKRRDFEYRLKRRAALKVDYYRYIEYETKLEQLRRLRKVQLNIKTSKHSVVDTAITRHIHFIYERATRKFKSDLQLWMDWLNYCRKTKANKMHSKVVTKALQRHATVPILWVEAATREFEHHGNVSAARALMQQGLRMCKHEEVMWAEYLRMELLYIERLRARRVVLGLDVPQEAELLGRGGKRGRKGAAREEEGEGEGAQAEGDAEGEGPAAEAAVRAVLTGAVARVVVRNAVAALPTSLSLRKALLKVLAQFEFPGVRQIEGEVYEGVASEFASDEEAWDVLARRPVDESEAREARTRRAKALAAAQAGGKGGKAAGEAEVDVGVGEGEEGLVGTAGGEAVHGQVCDVYRRALQAVGSERMYELYGGYLERRLERLMERAAAAAAAGTSTSAGPEAGAAGPGKKQGKGGKRGRSAEGAADSGAAPGTSAGTGAAPADAVVSAGAELLGLYASAHAARKASSGTYARWSGWAERLGQQRMALSAARQGCGRYPACRELWERRMDLEAKAGTAEGAGAGASEQLLKTLQQGVASVPTGETTELWLKVLEHIQPGTPGFSQLVGLMVTTVAGAQSGPPSGGLGRAAAAMLQRIREVQGIDAARAFYRQFLTLPAPGGEFFHTAIAIERQEEQQQQQQQQQQHRLQAASGSGRAAAQAGTVSAGQKAGSRAGAGAKAGAGVGGHVRPLFEAAVSAYGEVDADLWLKYARYEAAGLAGTGPIYWRATKALRDPDAFISKYQDSLLG